MNTKAIQKLFPNANRESICDWSCCMTPTTAKKLKEQGFDCIENVRDIYFVKMSRRPIKEAIKFYNAAYKLKESFTVKVELKGKVIHFQGDKVKS